jgi:hypothetical protein
LLLTPDGNRLRWVNDDGSLGDAVKLNEMNTVHAMLKATKPDAINRSHQAARLTSVGEAPFSP